MLTRHVGRLPAVIRGSHNSLRRLASLTKGPSPNDIFANGTNAYYADEMYRLWKQDPKSVHPSWSVYFSGLANGLSSPQAFHSPPTLTTHHLPHPADGAPALHVGQGGQLDDHLKVRGFILYLTCGLLISGPTSCPCIPSSWSSCCRA
jgi:2-oxoglutarate dehydrogenase E1 component